MTTTANESQPLLADRTSTSFRRRDSGSPRNKSGRDTNGTEAERSRRWYFVTIGISSILLLALAMGGFLATELATPPSDTPDYTKLPPPKPGLRNSAYLETGYHGAAATEVEVCSKIAIQVLKDGGTATDAGIAAALCIGVTNMFSSGIGGGGFLVIKPGKSNLNPNCTAPISIDFRETAPQSAYATMFAPRPDSTFDPARASKIGGLAVGVPGEIRGLEAAYLQCGGGVSWKSLFKYSADLARESMIGAELGRRLRWAPFGGAGIADWMVKEADWAAIFVGKNGKLKKEGDIFRREAYALTLEKIGREGADAFYHGTIADSIVEAVSMANGNLTHNDLENYKIIIEPALEATYRNRTYYTSHSPSGGPVLISLLNTLEGYTDYTAGKTGLAIHRFVEALKFAFAARTELGDPAFTHNSPRLKEIMTKEYAAKVRANITDDRTHSVEYYNPHFDVKEDHGTTHLSVIDSFGSAIALTTTINLLFGSRVMTSTGIMLNDEMDDFATPGIPDGFGLLPSPYNYPGPGKRPLSSTSPLIMDHKDSDRTWLAIGGSGGSRIFGMVAQVISNLDWGMDLSNAIESPRVHDQLAPAYVSIESGFSPTLINALVSRGHNISLFDVNLGIAEAQGVLLDERYFAASDSRKQGIAAAY